MSIPNDTDRRTIELRMTPMEAIMALESFSIGSATMITSDNRGRREAGAIQSMEARLIEQTGLSPRVARMLADGMSGIFQVATAVAAEGVSHVTLRTKREAGGLGSGRRIVAVVDDRELFLADIEVTPEERAPGIASGDFWEREKQASRLNQVVFDGIVGEIAGLLRNEARVDVEFFVETDLAASVPRRTIPHRNNESVSETLSGLMDLAFGTDRGEDAILSLDSDIWNDGRVVAVNGRIVVPYVHLQDAATTLQTTIDADPKPEPEPAPRPR